MIPSAVTTKLYEPSEVKSSVNLVLINVYFKSVSIKPSIKSLKGTGCDFENKLLKNVEIPSSTLLVDVKEGGAVS